MKQLRDEAQDWLFNALGAAVVAALVLLAVAGHAWVSAHVAHGQMPIIYTDTFMPTISTGDRK